VYLLDSCLRLNVSDKNLLSVLLFTLFLERNRPIGILIVYSWRMWIVYSVYDYVIM